MFQTGCCEVREGKSDTNTARTTFLIRYLIYLHLNLESLSPRTLNCETPSMNSATKLEGEDKDKEERRGREKHNDNFSWKP